MYQTDRQAGVEKQATMKKRQKIKIPIMDALKKTKERLFKIQNAVFWGIVVVGTGMSITDSMVEKPIFVDGIAFIIAGFVGLIMSWITADVAKSLTEKIEKVGQETKEEIRKVGKETKEEIRKVGTAVEKHMEVSIKQTEILEKILHKLPDK